MSSLPLFYHSTAAFPGAEIALEEASARHIVQVLRMQQGAQLHLTDGKGWHATTVITNAGKKNCTVQIQKAATAQRTGPALHLAIAFTKNTARNEWLLEKATELGVARITPLQTTRTEKVHARQERWEGILTSAMLQSQQFFLPQLDVPISFEKVVKAAAGSQILIAHCNEGEKQPIANALTPQKSTLILIGPEGDFTAEEVTLATTAGATAISLGNTRLRTETAAMAACAYFHLIND